MNADQATTLSSNQDLNELTITIKSVWHRPNLTRIEIKRTMDGSGPGSDCGTPTATATCT